MSTSCLPHPCAGDNDDNKTNDEADGASCNDVYAQAANDLSIAKILVVQLGLGRMSAVSPMDFVEMVKSGYCKAQGTRQGRF